MSENQVNVTASQVKELRERTGAGMMECKKALSATSGDIDAAIEMMRKSGMAKAAKKADRTAAEGVVEIKLAADQKSAVMLEVNCETDFVARDGSLLAFAENITQRALESKIDNLDDLLNLAYQNNGEQTVEQARQDLVAKLGENIKVRRISFMKSAGAIGAYKHGSRIGVLVQLDVANSQLGKDIAMHIAATNPQAVAPEDVSQELIAKEQEIFSAQASTSGKPAAIIEKMVEGRIKKFLSEISLLSQPFVKNPDETIADILKAANAKVIAFKRFEVGEGIEKNTTDFAQEVMAQVRGG